MSLRDQIMEAIVDELSNLAGWNVQRAGLRNTANEAVEAVVYLLGEEKDLASSNNDKTLAVLQVGILITVRAEDASPTTDASNAFRYLDRMVVLAEKQLVAADWSQSPGFTDFQLTGHDVAEPTEVNEAKARIRVTVKYRHQFDDPDLP